MADRCQALDMNGRQCQRKGRRIADVHLDSEIYGTKWVKTKLCPNCWSQLIPEVSSFDIKKTKTL